MTGRFRTATGGRIDRTKLLSFTFDGKRYDGFAGDTLASALLANGVHLVGRSYKYHRPRGILSAGAEEPNALVTIDRGNGRETPNLLATQVELFNGLCARSQNRWPSLNYDAGSVIDHAAPLFSAGFYYKTFMGPRFLGSNWAWTKLYEPAIRRMAGPSHAPKTPDPDRYSNRFAHCDVLIIGAGPAGLAAARTAAETGARVIICDEQAEPGGSLLAETNTTIDGAPAANWLADALASLAGNDRVTLLPRTQAFGYYAQNFVALAERLTDHLARSDPERPRERLWQVRAKRVILATGAIERPLVFPDNDRPGIMLADAARTYANRYAVLPGNRAVVATATDTGYRTALDLAAAGVEIALIADLREGPQGALIDAARSANLTIAPATVITKTSGRHRVTGVETGRVRDGNVLSRGIKVDCDLVVMSGGWTPSIHLFSQSRGKVAWDDNANAFLPHITAQAQTSAGACRGVFGLHDALDDGSAAGADAAEAAGCSRVGAHQFTTSEPHVDHRGVLGACPTSRPDASAFVDFQHDVTTKDLKLATREGFRSIEHVKRYTTTGMATDQGKTSNLNALGIVAKELGRPIAEVGLTTYRQPYTPVTFGTLASTSRGELFDPIRRTPIDGWAQERGAVFEDVGLWKRARYFPQAGEDMQAAVARECKTVREAVGILDATTLGKIEVVGPAAAEFLERMYINAWKGLKVGRCRYGVLLNEAGFIYDDGVIGRIAPDVFHVTTSTGGAPRVLHMMEDYLQTEFPELEVWLTSTTEQWAVIAIQGPKARDVLAPLVTGFDLSADALPHMGLGEGRICGIDARIFRVSFTGEAGFEVNVPAGYGRDVWQAIWDGVEKHGGCAYGTETMHVLRAEKGFIIVGQDTDGTVTPDDAGLGWAIGKKKPDFVGKRSLSRPDMVKPGRKQLVGLRTEDPAIVLEEGAQITDLRNPPIGTSAVGHVTSSYWSATLGYSIALAMVAGGRDRMGDMLFVPMPKGAIPVEITSPAFIDPKGERLNG
jgi:sarcosine oxidase subunit alpha